MQETTTLLSIIQERGARGLPLQHVYRMLYNRNLYLTAYGNLYRNQGAMTKGTTDETVDGMSLEKNRAHHCHGPCGTLSLEASAEGLHPQAEREDPATRPSALE